MRLNKISINILLIFLLISSVFGSQDLNQGTHNEGDDHSIAEHEESFVKAQEIITQGIKCESLNDSDLEMIGEFFMEQMHPGEAHIRMDEMMSRGNDERLKEIHINMAYRFYCGDEEKYINSEFKLQEYNSHSMMINDNEDVLMSNMMFRGNFQYNIILLLVIIVVLIIGILIGTNINNKKVKRKK